MRREKDEREEEKREGGEGEGEVNREDGREVSSCCHC